jgi:hypothetical protein
MKTLFTISATLLFLVATDVPGQEGKVTVRVTNEFGSPVTNATVHAGFATAIKPGWGWGAGKPNRVEGVTDTNGVCTLQGEGNGGSVGISAFKDGYYGSSGFLVLFTNLTGTIARKWEPWNPTVNVILKPIGDPIPMYVKSFGDRSVPVSGKPAGFDLIAGDWVAPHGKGKTSDFVLQYMVQSEGTIETRYGPVKTADRTLTVVFSNEGDGVKAVQIPLQGGSALRLHESAPENGYASNVVKRVVKDQNGLHSDIQRDQNYFFRVRTKKDDKGNIVSALYGKIYGDFQFDERGRVTFTYYLNPTPNDRNVEFDPAKNLFTGLSSREQVHEP